MYSADVVDSHGAVKPEQPESQLDPGHPSSLRDGQPVSDRAVIILIPVRLGGEKTNPDYFDFAKVTQRKHVLS